jgi:hypothetical protein
MHFNGIISELDLRIIDFYFTLVYLGQQFHFKANCVLMLVYCAIFKRLKIIVG